MGKKSGVDNITIWSTKLGMNLSDEDGMEVLRRVKLKAHDLKRTLKESEFKKIAKQVKLAKSRAISCCLKIYFPRLLKRCRLPRPARRGYAQAGRCKLSFSNSCLRGRPKSLVGNAYMRSLLLYAAETVTWPYNPRSVRQMGFFQQPEGAARGLEPMLSGEVKSELKSIVGPDRYLDEKEDSSRPIPLTPSW